jgi:hypothetical protein
VLLLWYSSRWPTRRLTIWKAGGNTCIEGQYVFFFKHQLTVLNMLFYWSFTSAKAELRRKPLQFRTPTCWFVRLIYVIFMVTVIMVVPFSLFYFNVLQNMSFWKMLEHLIIRNGLSSSLHVVYVSKKMPARCPHVLYSLRF